MRFFALMLLGTVVATAHPLFNGKSLDGWEIQKGEEPWWKVENGAIVGAITRKTNSPLQAIAPGANLRAVAQSPPAFRS